MIVFLADLLPLVVTLGIMMILLICGVVFVPRLFRAIYSSPAKRAEQRKTFLTCYHCGYRLTGVETPRCPECGCAFGFHKTFTELGVDETELVTHIRKKRNTAHQDKVNPTSTPDTSPPEAEKSP